MTGVTMVTTSEKVTTLTTAIENPKALKGIPREQLEATEGQLYAVRLSGCHELTRKADRQRITGLLGDTETMY